jgi:DNA repair exonuclease SbcCD ATPase subunit
VWVSPDASEGEVRADAGEVRADAEADAEAGDPLPAGFAEGWHDPDQAEGQADEQIDEQAEVAEAAVDAAPTDEPSHETLADGDEDDVVSELAGPESDDAVVAGVGRAMALEGELQDARARVVELEQERASHLAGLEEVAHEYRRRGALVRKLRTDVAATAEERATVAAELASVREQAERAEEERTLLLRRAESGEYLGVQLNAQLEELRTELDSARAAEAEARAELETAVADRDGRLHELETALSTSEAERRTTQAALAGRDERLRRLEQMLAERDEKLRSVEWELAEVGGRIVELEGQLGLEPPAPTGASADAGPATDDHPSA